MNWKNLEDGKCPTCECELIKHPDKLAMQCPGCTFTIGLDKYRKMLDKMDAERNTESNNQAALSEL